MCKIGLLCSSQRSRPWPAILAQSPPCFASTISGVLFNAWALHVPTYLLDPETGLPLEPKMPARGSSSAPRTRRRSGHVFHLLLLIILGAPVDFYLYFTLFCNLSLFLPRTRHHAPATTSNLSTRTRFGYTESGLHAIRTNSMKSSYMLTGFLATMCFLPAYLCSAPSLCS